MTLSTIETIMFSAIGVASCGTAVLFPRIGRSKRIMLAYAGALFFLGAFATFKGWVQFGRSHEMTFRIFQAIGAVFFAYIALTEYRKKPQSKRWIIALLVAVGFALAAIFRF
jgi:hypothetical protein